MNHKQVTAEHGDGMAYDVDIHRKTRQPGGKGNKMPNNTKTEAVKASPKRYAKTRGEHYKDIVIAVLVAGIIAFISGMHFSNQQHAATAMAVKSATAQATAVKK